MVFQLKVVPPQSILANIWRHFLLSQLGKLLLVSVGYRSELLQSIGFPELHPQWKIFWSKMSIDLRLRNSVYTDAYWKREEAMGYLEGRRRYNMDTYKCLVCHKTLFLRLTSSLMEHTSLHRQSSYIPEPTRIPAGNICSSQCCMRQLW